jgi:hypothetical protein
MHASGPGDRCAAQRGRRADANSNTPRVRHLCGKMSMVCWDTEGIRRGGSGMGVGRWVLLLGEFVWVPLVISLLTGVVQVLAR